MLCWDEAGGKRHSRDVAGEDRIDPENLLRPNAMPVLVPDRRVGRMIMSMSL